MLSPATRFQRLAQQFDTLIGNINDAQDPKERKRLLRRMKIVIDEIDALVSSSLKPDTASSPSPDQPTGD
jgi:hypothetical protein